MDSVAGNYFDDFVNVDFSGNWLKRVSYGFRQTIPRTGWVAANVQHGCFLWKYLGGWKILFMVFVVLLHGLTLSWCSAKETKRERRWYSTVGILNVAYVTHSLIIISYGRLKNTLLFRRWKCKRSFSNYSFRILGRFIAPWKGKNPARVQLSVSINLNRPRSFNNIFRTNIDFSLFHI